MIVGMCTIDGNKCFIFVTPIRWREGYKQLFAQSFYLQRFYGDANKETCTREEHGRNGDKEGLRGKEEEKAREAHETEESCKKRCTRVEMNVSVRSEMCHTSKRRHLARHKSEHFVDLEETDHQVNPRAGACQRVMILPSFKTGPLTSNLARMPTGNCNAILLRIL